MCGIDWLDFIQYVIVKKYSSTFWKPALTTPRASRSVCGLCAFNEVPSPQSAGRMSAVAQEGLRKYRLTLCHVRVVHSAGNYYPVCHALGIE